MLKKRLVLLSGLWMCRWVSSRLHSKEGANSAERYIPLELQRSSNTFQKTRFLSRIGDATAEGEQSLSSWVQSATSQASKHFPYLMELVRLNILPHCSLGALNAITSRNRSHTRTNKIPSVPDINDGFAKNIMNRLQLPTCSYVYFQTN